MTTPTERIQSLHLTQQEAEELAGPDWGRVPLVHHAALLQYMKLLKGLVDIINEAGTGLDYWFKEALRQVLEDEE